MTLFKFIDYKKLICLKYITAQESKVALFVGQTKLVKVKRKRIQKLKLKVPWFFEETNKWFRINFLYIFYTHCSSFLLINWIDFMKEHYNQVKTNWTPLPTNNFTKFQSIVSTAFGNFTFFFSYSIFTFFFLTLYWVLKSFNHLTFWYHCHCNPFICSFMLR